MVRNVTWEYQGKKKKNPTVDYCGTIWNYAMGVERDSEGKYMGFVVTLDTPFSFPSGGDYAFGLGFISQIWNEEDAAEWKKTSTPWSHKMGVTIKRKKPNGSFETLIDMDPISAGTKPVEKFYAIVEPGEYTINVKNIATGQCAPGGDDWLDYSRSYRFRPDQVSGYETPKPPAPAPEPKPKPDPIIETETKFQIGMLTPKQLLAGVVGVGLFLAIS